MQRLRPILGFGWAGWFLLPVAAALAVVYATGYDAVYPLQRIVARWFGIDALYWLMYSVHGHYYLSLYWPIFGPLSLLYLLVAIHLAPRDRPNWDSLLVAWAIIRPVAQGWVLLAWRGLFPGPPGTTSEGWLRAHLTLDVLTTLLLHAYTRSWQVTAAFVALSVVAWTGPDLLPVSLGWSRGSAFAPATWHVMMAALLIGWAIHQRRSVKPPGACPGCGYDLRGIAGPRCPECGASTAPIPAGQSAITTPS